MGKPPICVRCGRPNDGSTVFVGNVCIDCFTRSTRLLCIPEEVKVDYCKYCGAVRVGYRWLEAGEHNDALDLLVARHITKYVKPCVDVVEHVELQGYRLLSTPSWRTRVELELAMRVKGVEDTIVQRETITIRLNPTICPFCHMLRGGDYNVVVQLRGARADRLARVAEEVLSRNPAIAYKTIDVVEHGQHGIDILFYERGAASKFIRELSKQYQLKTKYTTETVGTDSTGRVRRRLVISVRLDGGEP